MPPSPVRLDELLTAQAEIEGLVEQLDRDHTPERAVELIPRLLGHPCVRHSSAEPQQLAGDLAHSLADLGRYGEAIEAWETAIANGYSSAPHPRAYVAESLVLSGRVKEGMELFDELKLQCPDDPWLRSAAGITCVLAEDHHSALRWFEEGVELSVDRGDSDRILAQLVELAAAARTHLRLEPDDALAERVASLEQLPAGAGRHWNEADPPPAAPPEGCARCGYEVGCDAPDGLDPANDRSGLTWGVDEQVDPPVDLPPAGSESDPFGLVDVLFGSGDGIIEDDPAGSSSAPLAVVRVGRNQPCPCGSGRKSKHCCG